MLSKGVKLLIAACGTVSSVASELGGRFRVPFTGVVAPTAAAAAAATKNGNIGVIGTTATIRSGSYKRALQKLSANIRVFQQDCPLFVPLVENNFLSPEDPVVTTIAARYLSRLKENGVDTIILGCTHYPMLKAAISKVMDNRVTLVDSGRETALYAARLLHESSLLNTENTSQGKCSFYVSDQPDGFTHMAGMFLQKEITEDVHRIDIEQY